MSSNKSDKKAELLLKKNNLVSNELNKKYLQIIETKKNEANAKGTLHSGAFDAEFKRIELERVKEQLSKQCENYRSVYCRRGFTKKCAEAFKEILNKSEENISSGFSLRLDREQSIYPEMKSQIKDSFMRDLRGIVSAQINQAEIEADERDTKIREKYGEPINIEKIIFRIISLWEESKIKAIGLAIFILLASAALIKQAFEILIWLSKLSLDK